MSRLFSRRAMAEAQTRYVNSCGSSCPVCGSQDLQGGALDMEAGEAWQPIRCNACGSTWNDTYALEGFAELEVADNAKANILRSRLRHHVTGAIERGEAEAIVERRLPDVPDDFPVRPLQPGEQAKDRATCGTCGRSWDDAIATGYTPVPSGRCPFEEFH